MRTTVCLPFQRMNPIILLFHVLWKQFALFVTGVTNRIRQSLDNSNDQITQQNCKVIFSQGKYFCYLNFPVEIFLVKCCQVFKSGVQKSTFFDVLWNSKIPAVKIAKKYWKMKKIGVIFLFSKNWVLFDSEYIIKALKKRVLKNYVWAQLARIDPQTPLKRRRNLLNIFQ